MTCLALLLAVTIQGPADVASLTSAADVVVRAQVVRVESGWAGGDPASGVIVTQVELRPVETWKGAPVSTVLVNVPGGSVGDLGQIAQGAATFAPGDEVVVFLKQRAPNVFQLPHWSLGKFLVRPDSGGNRRALRSREGVLCRDCRPGENDELSLDELKAKVVAAAEAK
jgi:hypothetical protein